jgi:hypothetical protein
MNNGGIMHGTHVVVPAAPAHRENSSGSFGFHVDEATKLSCG